MSEEKRSFPLWLSISVLMNILFVGLVAGYVLGKPAEMRGDGAAPPPGPLRSELVLGRGILEVTPREDRRELGQSFRRAMGQSGGQLRDRLAARGEIMSALRQEPFDPDAVADALESLRAADARLQDALHSRLVDALAGLTPEQRSELVELFSQDAEERARSRPRLRDRRQPPPPGD
ncbi:MAG: periplasmic heavy metal sensor [Pseudomonadota bacterium]